MVVILNPARGQEAGAARSRRASAQPVDGPNVTTDRDMAVGSGMEYGIVEGYERLDELLGADAPA